MYIKLSIKKLLTWIYVEYDICDNDEYKLCDNNNENSNDSNNINNNNNITNNNNDINQRRKRWRWWNFSLCHIIDNFFKHLPKPCWRDGMERVTQYKIQDLKYFYSMNIHTTLWWPLCCQCEQAVEQNVDLPVVWATITLKKDHCTGARGRSGKSKPTIGFHHHTFSGIERIDWL